MRFVCIILLLSLLVVSCSEDISNTGNSKGKAGGLVLPPPTSLSWSPDGDWILFMEFSAMQITRADDINDVMPISGTGQYTEPVWSPDAQRIAYVYAPRYLTSDIWVKFAHQNVPNIRITSDRSSDSSPSWSSDGTMIAFQSRRTGNWDIWLKKSDASGAAVQFTTDAGNDKNPVW